MNLVPATYEDECNLLRQMEELLSDAGYPLDNSNGHLIKNALAQLIDAARKGEGA